MNDATTPVEVDLDPTDGIIAISRRGVCLPLSLAEAQQVICQVAAILRRQRQPAAPTAAGAVDLALVEEILYRESGVVDPRDVPALMATITAAHTTAAPPATTTQAPTSGRW